MLSFFSVDRRPLYIPIPIPIPVPIYVPVPMAMYNFPTPFPVGLPVPIATPLLLPVNQDLLDKMLAIINQSKKETGESSSTQNQPTNQISTEVEDNQSKTETLKDAESLETGTNEEHSVNSPSVTLERRENFELEIPSFKIEFPQRESRKRSSSSPPSSSPLPKKLKDTDSSSDGEELGLTSVSEVSALPQSGMLLEDVRIFRNILYRL